ncbi:hypothetical protein G5I_06268 [Acromyrmex echinatior]|uniref:Uncharacterized protein n=1 Tax=Acromyrmex echinatior TaxID=103372 RepID=F4WKK4_ACREC|nr:hypothetical protein G5I_06268 [Acromyrmex echinatior]
MVKADSRHEKVIELRHSERLPAFIVPFTQTVKQQQRSFLLSPAKTRARRRFVSGGGLFTKADSDDKDCATTDLHKDETYLWLSENARDESEVMRRLYFAREKGSPYETDRGRFRNTNISKKTASNIIALIERKYYEYTIIMRMKKKE